MRLLALSDLHVDHAPNRRALEVLPAHPADWLLLGGDLAETVELTEWALRHFAERFARVFWVPGNHDLWCVPGRHEPCRGVAKYEALVEACKRTGVVSPEDDYVEWPGPGGLTYIVPLFLLYDYTFAPDGLTPEEVRAWSREEDIVCTDEYLLSPEPHPSIDAWCKARVAATQARLDALPADAQTVLLNHFPMRRDQIRLRRRLARFSPWCGTRSTEDWHRRYRARVVVTGHLHVPVSVRVDGVPFEEVSVGYPRDWNPASGLERRLRCVL